MYFILSLLFILQPTATQVSQAFRSHNLRPWMMMSLPTTQKVDWEAQLTSLREKRADELQAWPGCSGCLHWVPRGKCVLAWLVLQARIRRESGLLKTQRGFYALSTSVSQRAPGQRSYPVRLGIPPQSACYRRFNSRIRGRKYWNGFSLFLQKGRSLLLLNSGFESRPGLLTHDRKKSDSQVLGSRKRCGPT